MIDRTAPCGISDLNGDYRKVKKFLFLPVILFFILMFNIQCTNRQQITFIENSKDASAGDLDCYKIETPSATYFLEKKGLGLSSLIDKEGNDWVSFNPEKGTGAGGEYRGFPNAVFKQDGSFFHPLNAATEPSTSEVITVNSDKVSIAGKSGNGTWECRWDFYMTHCTFTMTKMPDGYNYWILYEGTPGGTYDDSDWWMTSAIKEKMPITTNHEGDIAGPEWIAFGNSLIARSIFLLNHQDDDLTDRFYQMKKKMTVFGFGRKGIKSYLNTVPHSFSIGILETDNHMQIAKEINDLCLQ